MKVAAILASLFAAAVVAMPAFTNAVIDPQPGQSFTLTYTATGPATILLKTGPTSNLVTVSTLGSGLTGGSFTFTLQASAYPAGTYAFEIDDSTGVNYSKQFQFAGTGTSTPTASSLTPTSTPVSSTPTSTPSSTSSSSTTSKSTTTTTSSSSSTSSTPTSSPTKATNLNNAQRSASSIALVLVTVAALIYFN